MDKMFSATRVVDPDEVIDLGFTCPSCGKEHKVTVNRRRFEKYQNGALVQECFPELDRFYREMLISHLCLECIEKIFNMPAPGHEAEFGEDLGECEMCGAPIWSLRNATAEGLYKCKSCGTLHMMKDGALAEVEK